ncbi:MAG: PilZ domain-containing protein [Thermodesulfobacteriota bacterium]
MFEDKRKFKRVATNVLVRFNEQKVEDKETRQYLQGVADNCSLGGMFLSTDCLMPKGTVLNLSFMCIDDGNEVHIEAKAIVRWVQRIRKPKGLGLEFFEFSGLGERDFSECLEKLFKEPV